MPNFIITTAVHPFADDGTLSEGYIADMPGREARAIRKARKLKALGNHNVMLFKVSEIGRRYTPVSLRTRARVESFGFSHNGATVTESGILLADKAKEYGHTFWRRNGQEMLPKERHK